jgi:hypothetical protein
MEKTAATLTREEPPSDGDSGGVVHNPTTSADPRALETSHQLPMSTMTGTPDGLLDSTAVLSNQDFGTEEVPFDFSILDNMEKEVDLWGNFSPGFDLPAIDTAFEGNLNMGIPQNWTVPWGYVAP